MSGNNVLEVHKGSANGFGLLWYKTGKLQTNGTVVWSDNGHEYDKGGAPRIAASGSNIIEVHQGSENTFGPLWYKTGQFQPNGDVVWSATAYYYDSGASPAVSLAGATILEVHIGSGNTVGPLWVREAEFQADGTVTWNSGFAYDTGAAPSIASAGALALEVHQDRAGLSTELYRTFRY